MVAIPEAQITHESETQRQHVRFSLPAQVLVKGREYEIKNISAGGLAILGMEEPLSPGRTLPLVLRFSFDGFSFSARLDAEVRYVDAVNEITGCRFINLNAQQVSFLSHIIKSYIAGDVVTSGGILNVAARNNFVKPRSSANSNAAAPGIGRQLPGLLAIMALGVLIISFIAHSLYNSIFIVRSDDAAVAAPAVAVRAPSSGIFRLQINPDLALVKQDQAIGAILSPTGAAATLRSPCTCYITKLNVADGEMASAGDRILSLTPVDAAPWVVASLPPAESKRIGPATRATVSIFGARKEYTGHVVDMESALSADADGKAARLKIVLDEKLPVSFVNRLASVTFAIH